MPKLKDTMIMAQNFKKMINFYHEYVGLEIVEMSDDWCLLKDKETQNTICITNGPSVRSTSPGIEVDNLDKALVSLKEMGGSVHKTWEFGSMKGANCYDPENNELMIWQGSH